MRVTLAVIIMTLSLQAGAAVAGTGYERCSAEEKALRAEAADRCSGLSYLLNPSGCFIAQKAWKAFDSDNCRAIGRSEKTEAAPPAITVAVPIPRSDSSHEKASPEPYPPETAVVEQLKAENVRLKAEIARLRAEMEQLRKD